jgi:hypothetical protein
MAPVTDFLIGTSFSAPDAEEVPAGVPDALAWYSSVAREWLYLLLLLALFIKPVREPLGALVAAILGVFTLPFQSIILWYKLRHPK